MPLLVAFAPPSALRVAARLSIAVQCQVTPIGLLPLTLVQPLLTDCPPVSGIIAASLKLKDAMQVLPWADGGTDAHHQSGKMWRTWGRGAFRTASCRTRPADRTPCRR